MCSSDLEDSIQANPDLKERGKISAIRRQTAVVRRYLAPQRDALETFSRNTHSVLEQDALLAIREQSDRFMRYVEDIDLLRERAMVIQEELMNLIMQEQSDRTYVLSIVAAIFLPITFITGLFGMNVAGLPGLEEPTAFNAVAVIMTVVTVFIIGYLKYKKWW